MVLVQVEGAADEEGNVIFHGQVQDVSQGIDLQSIGIFVVCAVDGVVEREKVFRFLKDKTEEPVLVLPVCLGIFISIYEVDFKCYTSIIDIKTESCNLLRAHIKGNKRRKPPVE